MTERCENCEGPIRESCDARFKAMASMLVSFSQETAVDLDTNNLVGIMEHEGELADATQGFLAGQEVDGCTLSAHAIFERMQEEVKRYPWEQTSNN